MGMLGSTHRSDNMVSMPSPATSMSSSAKPKRTALPSRSPIARRGVSIGALPSRIRSNPSGSSHVRCTPVIRPSHPLQDRLRFGTRQVQESPRFLRDLAEVAKPKAFSDDVEQITVLGGRGVCPLAGRSLRRVLEPHEHRAARTIVDITDQPVAPLAPALGEIMAAHGLGLAR